MSGEATKRSETPRRVDVAAARARFDAASDDHLQAFETFFFARFLDLSFDYLPLEAASADKEICRIRFPVADFLFNPQGVLHGGVIASVMDISMGHLIRKVSGPGATIEMKVQFLRPVGAGDAVCEGRFLRRGRDLCFMESRLWDVAGKLSAAATATWKAPAEPGEGEGAA